MQHLHENPVDKDIAHIFFDKPPASMLYWADIVFMDT